MNHYRRGERAAKELIRATGNVDTAAAVLAQAINGEAWEEHADATRGATDAMLVALTA